MNTPTKGNKLLKNKIYHKNKTVIGQTFQISKKYKKNYSLTDNNSISKIFKWKNNNQNVLNEKNNILEEIKNKRNKIKKYQNYLKNSSEQRLLSEIKIRNLITSYNKKNKNKLNLLKNNNNNHNNKKSQLTQNIKKIKLIIQSNTKKLIIRYINLLS